jgi:hypothetical protein
MSALGIRILIANSCKRWRESLKSSHRMEDRLIFLKISAPHSFIPIYGMNLLLDRSILLDSNFKYFL